MLPLSIANATRRMAENQKRFTTLPIRDEIWNGTPVMVSLWEPSPSEARLLAGGGVIQLSIIGEAHPPVHICAQPSPGLDEVPRNTGERLKLIEDPEERKQFDLKVRRRGGPLRAIAEALESYSQNFPQQGSFSQQLIIMANEAAAAADRAGEPDQS